MLIVRYAFGGDCDNGDNLVVHQVGASESNLSRWSLVDLFNIFSKVKFGAHAITVRGGAPNLRHIRPLSL